MKKISVISAIMLLWAVFAWPVFGQQIPEIISYQGMLTDTNGTPLDGNYDIVANIYDVQVAGSPLWSETHIGVPIKKGVFSIMLGNNVPFDSVSPPVDFGTPYWLGVSVNGAAELSPRLQFSSASTALMSKSVVDGAITGSKIANNAVSGSNISNGQVVRSINGKTDHVNLPSLEISCDWDGWALSVDDLAYVRTGIFGGTEEIKTIWHECTGYDQRYCGGWRKVMQMYCTTGQVVQMRIIEQCSGICNEPSY